MDAMIRGLTPLIVAGLLAFLSSIWWSGLPNMQLLILLLIAVGITFPLKASKRQASVRNLALASIIGVFCAASVGHWYDSWQLSEDKFQQDVIIQGQVTEVSRNALRQRLQIDVVQVGAEHYWLPRKIRLTFYNTEQLLTERSTVRLAVRLKRPRGLANPEGFDYSRWLLLNNIVATGYVRNIEDIWPPTRPGFRQRLIQQISALSLEHKRYVLALSMGDRSLMEDTDWQMLQTTGLAHLFAISGLHLSVVCGILLTFLPYLLRVVTSFRLFEAIFKDLPQISLKPLLYLCCAGFCTGYAYLAGWQLPVVRALVSILIVLLLASLRLRLSIRHITLTIFAVVLTISPLSIHGMSLWMSFSAVFVIALYHWRFAHYKDKAWYKKLSRVCHFQLILTIAMLPIVLGYFGTLSLVSVPANLLFVPLVTLVIVPLCLCAVVTIIMLPGLGASLFNIADWLIGILISVMQRIDELPYAALADIQLPGFELFITALAILLLLLPKMHLRKPLLASIGISLLLSVTSRIYKDDNHRWAIHIFDAGQGTAIVVVAQGRAIVIDTGPEFDGGMSIAKQIILPFLQAQGITQLDHMFVSHYDNDHAGGMQTLRDGIEIMRFTGPESCRRGDSVTWEYLHIEVLWPTAEWLEQPGLSNNDTSCVLRISDQQTSILLSGDIERAAETALVVSSNQEQQPIRADILIAPHHGSNTSSSWGFINAVRAQYVIFTTGFANRFNFPHPEVLRRYRHWQPQLWNTANQGYIRIIIDRNNKEAIEIASWRRDLNRRWFD